MKHLFVFAALLVAAALMFGCERTITGDEGGEQVADAALSCFECHTDGSGQTRVSQISLNTRYTVQGTTPTVIGFTIRVTKAASVAIPVKDLLLSLREHLLSVIVLRHLIALLAMNRTATATSALG